MTQPCASPEWLVTNGLGGYASGHVSGPPLRRSHGLLIAALPGSRGRMMMLNHLSVWLRLPGGARLCIEPPPFGAAPGPEGAPPPLLDLVDFRLDAGLPVWRYQGDGLVLEKQVLMPHLQNTTHITFRLLRGDGPVRITLEPMLQLRNHQGRVDQPLHPERHVLLVARGRYEIRLDEDGDGLPPLRLSLIAPHHAFIVEPRLLRGVEYPIERDRGYDAVGDLYCPGRFRADLRADPRPGGADDSVTLIASVEPWEAIHALSPAEALRADHERRRRLLHAVPGTQRDEVLASLVLAADSFLITPAGRVMDAARAHAAGDEVRTVIAGYPWFTDWGRDTMISLEGLTMATGRLGEARYILHTFAHYVRDGLLPNLFPESGEAGLYHTADATLWFFHAIDRFLLAGGERETLRIILPRLVDIVEHHLRGTRFGIGVDPRDGLLRQGAPGYQLTWMDAKVGDWVVTPRRGKAVEINALWYNALRLLEGWVREEHGPAAARPYGEHAEAVWRSFNARFFYARGGYLYDVIDGESGDDPACRPNQVLALSLAHPVLEPGRWRSVLQVVEERLLTPVGLRTLDPGHPDYRQRYDGDLRARDAAYHQGTVWPWLLGPFIDAWRRVYPEDAPGPGKSARRFLLGLVPHLREACVGSISEIFDAEPPFCPRGCIAQAWSVAEMLRCWRLTDG
jgi:predicted glycogen debranching enzyme